MAAIMATHLGSHRSITVAPGGRTEAVIGAGVPEGVIQAAPYLGL